MIEVDRVSKQFGSVQAVRDVSMTIQPGVVTGLLGPNGAGKTTLIRMMTGFLTPSRGSVRICGHDAIEDSGRARACVGSLPESAPLYPEMRVRQFLEYRAQVFGVSRAKRRAAIDSALTRCNVADMASRRIGQLSKGYRQRVGLAAAILHDPAVLILDEPSSGLDPTQIHELRSLIRQLATGGPTGKRVVLLSSHYLPEVQATCDEILIIARGQLKASGTPDQLLAPLRASAPFVVEVVTESAEQQAGLAQRFHVPGVRLVEATAVERGLVLRIQPVAGATADLAPELYRAAMAAGVTLRRLTRVEPTLEQFFMSAVEDASPARMSNTPAAKGTPPASEPSAA